MLTPVGRLRAASRLTITTIVYYNAVLERIHDHGVDSSVSGSAAAPHSCMRTKTSTGMGGNLLAIACFLLGAQRFCPASVVAVPSYSPFVLIGHSLRRYHHD